ncbi:hypothetical protein JXB28_01015 [Candidatus Woesearchaeota archaeon]|nr:hypothetical protein [Candidatus Woesearchaeota archaeon]
MDDPFKKYFAVKKEGVYCVQSVFRPELAFKEKKFSLYATMRSGEQAIYSLKDVVLFEGKFSEGARNNFLGLIGERVLSVTMEKLIEESIDGIAEKEPGAQLIGGVVRESEKREGKEFVATYNSHYLLKHKGKSNFVVLKKTESNRPGTWYQQEKSGLQASEIDGLGYLHHNDKKYLLIGESKMINNWWNMDYDEFYSTLKDRIIIPFKALFPPHELIFFFLGKESTIFDNGGCKKLKNKSCQLAELLDDNGIKTIFAPLPAMPRSLEDYAQDMYEALPLTREMLKIIERMI